MHSNNSKQGIKVGNKVTFHDDKVEVFRAETRTIDKAIRQYQQLVLRGIDQIGIVKELNVKSKIA